MVEILLKILPVVAIFFLGFFLKLSGIFKKESGDLLLKIVFFVSLPALILISVTRIELELRLIYFPIISALIILVTGLVAWFAGRALKLQRTTLGVFLVGSMIMNIGFQLPFVIAAYGDEGLGRILLFDLSNGLLAFTLVYYIACKHGKNGSSKSIFRKFLLSVPLWALLIAFGLNFGGIEITGSIHSFLKILGDLTIPLVMLSLGFYLSPKFIKLLPLFTSLFIRMLFGCALGYLLALLFGLEGLDMVIVVFGAAAPPGFNTIVFANIEDLDKEFSSSLVSFSILIGIIVYPIMIVMSG